MDPPSRAVPYIPMGDQNYANPGNNPMEAIARPPQRPICRCLSDALNPEIIYNDMVQNKLTDLNAKHEDQSAQIQKLTHNQNETVLKANSLVGDLENLFIDVNVKQNEMRATSRLLAQEVHSKNPILVGDDACRRIGGYSLVGPKAIIDSSSSRRRNQQITTSIS